jgi:hypothetical protein
MGTQPDGKQGADAPPTLDYAGRLPKYRSVSSVAVASLLAAFLGPPLVALALITLADDAVLLLVKLLIVAANVVLPAAAIVDVRLSRGSRTGIGLALLSPVVFVAWLVVGLFVLMYSARRW